MNYFKIIYRTGEEDWETSEVIIDEIQHAKIQDQMSEGSDFIFVKDKATIKRTAIVSITSANNIVVEYQRQGIKIDGLLKPVESRPLISDGKPIKSDIERRREMFKKMLENLNEKNWWKRAEYKEN